MAYKHGAFNQKLAELSLITCNYVLVQSSLVGAWSAKATFCWYQSRCLYKFLKFFFISSSTDVNRIPGIQEPLLHHASLVSPHWLWTWFHVIAP